MKNSDDTHKIRDGKSTVINVGLTKKDIGRIFTWYDKGFTNVDRDKPLHDRLRKVYDTV